MSRERHRQRVRDVRDRLAHDGPPWTRDRPGDFDAVTVPERDCDALRDLLIAEGVETVVEVGLAYGRSALAIGEALVAVAAGRPLHVVIDPLQATEWSNVGWQPPVPRGVRRSQFPAQDRPARRDRRSGRPLVALGTHRGTLFRAQHGLAGRSWRLRRRHDRSEVRTSTPPGAPPARPCFRTGIRAFPAVLMPAGSGGAVVASARAAPPPWRGPRQEQLAWPPFAAARPRCWSWPGCC
jgi:hypothetical protein